MKLLAFETSTEACSVALYLDGEVRERFDIAPRRHAELALPWAGALLAEAGVARAQLDAIAVGRGPGAFTGVRLAIALAQGVALALERPVVALSTLQVLAAGAPADGPEHILAAIDARMGEVYAAAFRREGAALFALDAERVLPPEAVELPAGLAGPWQGVGTGFAAAGGALARRLGDAVAPIDAAALPRAGELARLAAAAFARGEAVVPERIEPAYLRDNVALTLAEQQALRARR
ncbi:tRNA (adenosine(37)-N6)-threonylcarbamoyltransferase complex dimerization subunit type 1 TsaB [Pseudoxanthomonas sp. J35]|uniref:tRNA (adenosine(37)-N6)-threonylcarbamoyltransferase complex dimerization subunit type 1 TsaB n=1 Tax=Pseudoxanthomonas sp. J35 TaxID=935852 RepID=UPI00048E5F64|nr:tRNA (adenosine(37)-N6)-threonylcarbamoyltransferase complex dimerization subunit type 1 TsaB [Pseudoxanthomonas sp. J35]